MKLALQKRLAAVISKVSPSRISFDNDNKDKIKSAITRGDIRGLINQKLIKVKPMSGISKFRTRKIKIQKRKGRRKSVAGRKGKNTARFSRKQAWINKIRIQRRFIKELKEKSKIDIKSYQELYKKIKGGFFRSRRHIITYSTEHRIIKDGKK